ncbi:hypothetical protein BDZ89DRAFT_458742 [Hymenopellis radicata]|nr:hypothetical protein BDZ89DRAFT_458742 [Hymenopellis radicata]
MTALRLPASLKDDVIVSSSAFSSLSGGKGRAVISILVSYTRQRPVLVPFFFALKLFALASHDWFSSGSFCSRLRRTYKPSRNALVPPQPLAMFKLAIIFAIPLFFRAALAQDSPPGLYEECGSFIGTVECADKMPCCYLHADYGVCMVECPEVSKA